MLLCSSCGVNLSHENTVTITPGFVTAALPPTRIPPPANTDLPITPAPVTVEGTTPPAVEGKTTTQLNVRAETSTASETVGTIKAYEIIQVIGRDSSGSWYQILYSGSVTGKGWVRAEYVQIADAAQLPVIGGVTDSGSGVSGLVIQKINVRSGPGTTFESLGVLNPKDVVFITGRDTDAGWLQIEFGSAPDGKGWLTAKYVQVENPDSIPVLGTLAPATGTPEGVPATPPSAILSAPQDGDSLQAPNIAVTFSAAGTHILQVSGEVSTPDGDAEDWVQFTPYTKNILVEVICSSASLQLELWSKGQFTKDIPIACAGKLILPTIAGGVYSLRIPAENPGPPYIRYSLKITSIE